MVPVEPPYEILRAMVKCREGNAVYKIMSDEGLRDLELQALADYQAALSAAPKTPPAADTLCGKADCPYVGEARC